ncbi:CBS domain-containing protein [Desulfococcus sp.]|uniref:CBS domain-containing protein n=1 Tax=Desulfococcus sp. TaxID=2025834 RepID=UPI0035948524
MHSKTIVETVMHPLHQYSAVGEDERVDRALELLSTAVLTGKMPHLMVIGKDRHANETIRGFVSPCDIVFGVAGHVLRGSERVGPIFWEGLLENEAPEAFSKRVSEIMAPVSVCAGSSQNILEAIFLLNKHRASFMPVVRRTEVVGVIHLDDILKVLVGMASRKKP